MDRKMTGKNSGNIMDFLSVGIALLAITIIVMASFYSMGLMLRKLEISQVARKYILAMETRGYMTEEVRQQLLEELQGIGLAQIDLSGTTSQPVPYGDTIMLKIRGRVNGNVLEMEENMWSAGFRTQNYYVEEIRMSTAKN